MIKRETFLQSKTKSASIARLASETRHVVAELDPSILQAHRRNKTKSRWRGQFTIASWVRFPEGLTQSASLVLVYRDKERQKSYKIDTCRANRQTLILLNGNVELDIVPEVKELSLVLEGLADNSVWILDEYKFLPNTAISTQKKSPRTSIAHSYTVDAHSTDTNKETA